MSVLLKCEVTSRGVISAVLVTALLHHGNGRNCSKNAPSLSCPCPNKVYLTVDAVQFILRDHSPSIVCAKYMCCKTGCLQLIDHAADRQATLMTELRRKFGYHRVGACQRLPGSGQYGGLIPLDVNFKHQHPSIRQSVRGQRRVEIRHRNYA